MLRCELGVFGASVDARVCAHGVLVLRYRGPITAGVLDGLAAGLDGAAGSSHAAAVVDVQGALLALGDIDLLRLVVGTTRALRGLPAAIVSPRDSLGVMRRAVIAAGAQGLRRVVLTEHGQAHAWAQAQIQQRS